MVSQASQQVYRLLTFFKNTLIDEFTYEHISFFNRNTWENTYKVKYLKKRIIVSLGKKDRKFYFKVNKEKVEQELYLFLFKEFRTNLRLSISKIYFKNLLKKISSEKDKISLKRLRRSLDSYDDPDSYMQVHNHFINKIISSSENAFAMFDFEENVGGVHEPYNTLVQFDEMYETDETHFIRELLFKVGCSALLYDFYSIYAKNCDFIKDFFERIDHTYAGSKVPLYFKQVICDRPSHSLDEELVLIENNFSIEILSMLSLSLDRARSLSVTDFSSNDDEFLQFLCFVNSTRHNLKNQGGKQ